MTSSTWRRRSGLVTTANGQAARARAFLEGALVVALLESEPENPDAVTVAVATDADDRVAVIDDDRAGITAGPTLAELAEALAEGCDAHVAFDDVVAGTEVEPPDDPSDPFDPEIEIVSAYLPDRSVVYTHGGPDDLVALATAVGSPMLAAPTKDGQLLLVTDGPPLSAVEWPDGLKPALVVEQGAAYPVVAIVDGISVHMHTWDAEVTWVPTTADLAGIVEPFVESSLGTGALVAEIVRLLPDADPAATRSAIDGPNAGPGRLMTALGLPEALVDFLGHADVPHLDDAHMVQPEGVGHAFARAVTDAQVQMSESVREHTEQMRERAEQMRERAEAARVRAESAFDAAETFTEEVVVPIQQSWWTPAVAAVEVAAGAFLLRRAGRGSRAGTGTTAGERVLAIGGIALLIDAVVNTAVFLAPRLKRDL